MERHDRQAAAGLQRALRRVQRPGELAELVVDRDPERLEGAGGGVDAGLGPDVAGDELREFGRGLDPPAPAALDDAARER